jgi:hypothetical protein
MREILFVRKVMIFHICIGSGGTVGHSDSKFFNQVDPDLGSAAMCKVLNANLFMRQGFQLRG